MKRRLLIATGFCIGLSTASLLNPAAHSRIVDGLRAAMPAIAAQLAPVSERATSPQSTSSFSAIPASAAYSCSANLVAASVQATSLLSASQGHSSSKGVRLLNHVPTLQQRLDWYSITRSAAIANAPRRSAPEPTTIEWHHSPEPIGLSDSCAEELNAIAQAQSSSHWMDLSSADPSSIGLDQMTSVRRSLLQQQSHFILALVTLTQDSDWILKPAPQASPIVHRMWLTQDQLQALPANLKIATQFEVTARF